MKVIFTAQVPGVASKGDVRNVRPRFFRNFLLPYKKAVIATDPLLREWEARRKKMLIEKEQLKAHIEEMKRRIGSARLRIEKKLTAKGTLYGGVKASDVTKMLKEQLQIEVPEDAVSFDQPIKAAGNFDVTLKLGEGVETMLPIEVVNKE
ncbi:50S ribosomal protein L9 [Candidatus Peregrinibacteria bacterium]|nr:50S ribosomal protein L9 [Candidatus Peregrinibacteria bacterium]